MIGGTEKPKIPSKFAKRAALYNKFRCKTKICVDLVARSLVDFGFVDKRSEYEISSVWRTSFRVWASLVFSFVGLLNLNPLFYTKTA